jgi:hypothetical protein
MPVAISAIIGFYSLLNLFSLDAWHRKCYAIAFPVWVVYLMGMLRVMIAYCKWSKCEVILFKLLVLACGLVYFYVGFEYMNGKYKITKGHYIAMEEKLRDLVYLYVFGVLECMFEMYRRLSKFDQTDELKY